MTDTNHLQRIVRCTGADTRNAYDRQQQGDLQDWQPWAADVMVLAGTYDGIAGGHPWLYLACRSCGWWLGYSSQHTAQGLAAAARAHSQECGRGSDDKDPGWPVVGECGHRLGKVTGPILPILRCGTCRREVATRWADVPATPAP